jgi:transposase
LNQLSPYQNDLQGLVVESTYNWYWLVDGLMEAGYQLHLANTAAIQQYSGLKHTDDQYDARWLAHMLNLGILKEGYIYPKADRAVRDLLRKRSQLVRQRTTQILSIQNLITRNTGFQFNGNKIKKMDNAQLSELFPFTEQALAAQSNLAILKALNEQIEYLEESVNERVQPRKEINLLKTVAGVGVTLGWTILLETGDIHRFAKTGNYASYCRCVQAKRYSNKKTKGENNSKNGNQYLAWAFIEAANFAVRYYPPVKSFYQRKKAKTNGVVAIKAVAHKLSRATYHVLRDLEPFDINKAFA